MARRARTSRLILQSSNRLTSRSDSVLKVSDAEDAFDELRRAVDSARRSLIEHPIYDAIDTLPHLQIFMATHVYAVWDFMCLAKRLQRDLTSMEPLWRPPSKPALARFINGVIHGEESDLGHDGEAISHCQLYIAAMEEIKAPTESIRRFLNLIHEGAKSGTSEGYGRRSAA